MKVAQSYHFNVNNLACWRGGRQVFSGLSFSLHSGEALLVTGANGCGKTSLLQQIAGFLDADGIIALSGYEILCHGLHFIGMKDGAKAHLTVMENLRFWRDLLNGEDLLDRALHAFGLRDLADMPVQHLSSGQRRRLALSRLFVAKRPLWLLDEPLAALDAENQLRLHGVVQEHLNKGGLAILTSHVFLNLPNIKLFPLGADS